MNRAQEAIEADEAFEQIGGLLEEADEIMTEGMTEAEAAMRPLNKVASHVRSPELAMRQRKAALGKKYAAATRKQMRKSLRKTFEAKAKAIYPSWKLPTHGRTAMAKWEAALTKRARKAKRDQRKLRREFLEKRLRESVSARNPEEQQEAIETILKRDKMRQNHLIIHRRLKRARPQLKCVIGEDRQRISGQEDFRNDL